MSKRKGLIGLLPFLALASLFLSGIALAQTGDGYDLSWSTVDGGGYSLSGGLWGTIVDYLCRLFLPLIFKNYGP